MPHDRRQCRALTFPAAVGASGVIFLSTIAYAHAVPNADVPGASEVAPQSSASPPTSSSRAEIESRGLGSPRAAKDPQGAAKPIGKPESTGPADMLRSLWRTGGALAVVLGIAVALAWATKRLARTRGTLSAAIGPGGASPSGVLEVLGRYPLSRGITLVLLKIDARVLLVSQSVSRAGASMQTLCEINEPDQVASILLKASRSERASIADRFQALLSSNDRAIEKELAPTGRQVFRTMSGDTVELASVSGPVPLARVATIETTPPRRGSSAEFPATIDQTRRAPRQNQAATPPAAPNPGGSRGYSSTGATRPLTGAEQLRRRLDAWCDREERAS